MAQKKHKKRKQHTKKKVEQTAGQGQEASLSKQDARAEKKAEKEKAAKKAAAKGSGGKKAENVKPGIFRRFANYCKAVRVELQRVVWPTRKELLNASLIVIGAIVFFGIYIAIIDNIIIIPLDWIAALGA